MSYIYFFRSGNKVKIGRSASPRDRYNSIRTMNAAGDLEVIGVLPDDGATERELHARFARYRLHGEWFEFAPEIRGFVHNRCGHVARVVEFMVAHLETRRGARTLVCDIQKAFRAFERKNKMARLSGPALGDAFAAAIELGKIRVREVDSIPKMYLDGVRLKTAA